MLIYSHFLASHCFLCNGRQIARNVANKFSKYKIRFVNHCELVGGELKKMFSIQRLNNLTELMRKLR